MNFFSNIFSSRLSHVLSVFLLATMLHLSSSASVANAQNFERMPEIESDLYGEMAFVSGDYESMKAIRRFWVNEAQRLKSMRQLEFTLTGSNEAILKVTIPARLLYAQGDTTFLASAETYLRPLLRLIKGPEAVATIIIASHTDNNGSDAYLSRLSKSRAAVMHRWMAKQGVGPTDIHSFGWGNKVPRNENKNIRERERNRRVSIYLVPNKQMLKQAKKGKL